MTDFECVDPYVRLEGVGREEHPGYAPKTWLDALASSPT
jgi:hypothetical protein